MVKPDSEHDSGSSIQEKFSLQWITEIQFLSTPSQQEALPVLYD